ncbi:hypothetical protein CK203_036367 [Vitis vinifera]|uniref:Reverse transcriptase domain-containing protein n=1 Tax=Vitis vinifera TaxID=29760 RepID=A0A438HYT9_VITVI|nr:hypothetical protein CK203_036367 [Vitis vinifera]
MGESTQEDYEPHSWTGGRRLVEKAKSTTKGWSSVGAVGRVKEGEESQKTKDVSKGTHGKRRAEVGNSWFQPSSLFNLNSNKERIRLFGPKQVGEVWAERDKAHSNVEDWHWASNAMQERRTQSPLKPIPLVEANLGWERGVILKGLLSTLGQEMGGKQPIFEKGSLCREDSFAMGKGKSVLKVSVSQLRGVQSRSEPLTHEIPSSDFVAPPKGNAFEAGTQLERRFSASPLTFSRSSGFRKSCSGERASSRRGDMDNQQRSSLKASRHSKGKEKLHKSSNVEDRAVSEGFGGFVHRDSSVMVFPSNPVIREKGLNSVGTCGMMVVENIELACLNQMSEGINSLKTMPSKRAKVREVLSSLDINVYSRRKNRFSTAQRALRKGELEELISREEVHWRQKVRVKWVKEGDCNSKFFHKVANGRRNRKFIKFLENKRGLVLNNIESITKEILLYYEKLYSSPLGESWKVEGLDWSLSQKRVLLAEVLSGRLKGVLHETIHSPQGAFVQGRQILDVVLIVNEIVDEKRRLGEEGVVFKIDFEKAYDHVDWDFLDHVLEKKGFSPRWRTWMRYV